ncbi:hypothetical protein M378DRAFT_904202 [Amanita muscaria Koide BX008]|uniref:Uncharacterized protein n=1 Tax=Amanita muscaria (strain Koide BX008) TaxID=946122 RepID=A0A0C2WC30_AMAMK|nr:hypothetical protein M378DRAFT_904202 [Amanita muscaria Koide BX008]
MRRIFKVFKGKGKRKNNSTPVPTNVTAPELGNSSVTDAQEHVNPQMVKDSEHDQERSESTSLGSLPPAEENPHDGKTLKDTTQFPVHKADDDARAGSSTIVRWLNYHPFPALMPGQQDKGDSAKNASGQGSASRNEDKIAAGVVGSTDPVKVLGFLDKMAFREIMNVE